MDVLSDSIRNVQSRIIQESVIFIVMDLLLWKGFNFSNWILFAIIIVTTFAFLVTMSPLHCIFNWPNVCFNNVHTGLNKSYTIGVYSFPLFICLTVCFVGYSAHSYCIVSISAVSLAAGTKIKTDWMVSEWQLG